MEHCSTNNRANSASDGRETLTLCRVNPCSFACDTKLRGRVGEQTAPICSHAGCSKPVIMRPVEKAKRKTVSVEINGKRHKRIGTLPYVVVFQV